MILKNRNSVTDRYITHLCCFCITLILIITTYFGFTTGILFGVIQLLSSLFMLFCWRELAKHLDNQVSVR